MSEAHYLRSKHSVVSYPKALLVSNVDFELHSRGDARPLTDMNGSIGSFQWSPDGRQIVLTFRKEGDGPGVSVVRLITRLDYKDIVEGFLPTERYHIWLVDAATGGARR